MNSALEILSGLVVLLVTMFILKRRKKCSLCSSKETSINKTNTSDQEKQQPETKPAAKIVVNAEATTANSQITNATVISSPVPESVNKPVTNIETSAKPSTESSSSGFPHDSVLKRHYFHHLCTMIEALAPQCPEDSVLRRHYYAMLISQIDQCLQDTKAMERLANDYEHLSA